LELEHRSGDIAPLFALAQLWRRHGGLWLDSRSKAIRGATLAKGLVHGTPVKARAPALERDMDASHLLRTVMLSTLEQVLGNASELAAGSSDEEHVHQLRIGVRRLRTVLRELAPLSEGFMSGWEPALSNAFAQLGAIRDDHAVAAAVRPLLERAGAPKLGWRSVNTADDPGPIVRADSFQDTLLDLLRWALSEPAWATPKHVPHEARRCLVERLSRLHRQVTRGGEAFEQLPEAEQHQVRKRLKRLRYLAELVCTMWAHKATQRYLRRLSLAQDALGHHNDVTVAAAKFLADAQQDPLSLFAAGYLKAHEAVTARQAHVSLAHVTRARCFWKD
jgi:CHAD domain-containing protein